MCVCSFVWASPSQIKQLQKNLSKRCVGVLFFVRMFWVYFLGADKNTTKTIQEDGWCSPNTDPTSLDRSTSNTAVLESQPIEMSRAPRAPGTPVRFVLIVANQCGQVTFLLSSKFLAGRFSLSLFHGIENPLFRVRHRFSIAPHSDSSTRPPGRGPGSVPRDSWVGGFRAAPPNAKLNTFHHEDRVYVFGMGTGDDKAGVYQLARVCRGLPSKETPEDCP